jgi:uncharacterized protein (DUF362 family)
VFNEAIVAINRALRPVVLGDGTYFLDKNGPMQGEPVRMDLIIAATSAGAFDRYLCEVMGVDWRSISHLRRAARTGAFPAEMADLDCNAPAAAFRVRRFTLRRSVRTRIALVGFRSRFVTWLGYESWFGRRVLHRILYALVGPPISRQKATEVPSDE